LVLELITQLKSGPKSAIAMFKKLASGDRFPEFAAFSIAMSDLRSRGQTIIEHSTSAFADPFVRFTDAQPYALRPALEGVLDAGKRQNAMMSDLSVCINRLTYDLKQLRILNDDLQRRHADVRAARETAQKSHALQEKLREALVKAERRGKSLEIAKYQAQVAAATAKADGDAKRADDLAAALEVFEEQYRMGFADHWTLAMLSAAGSKERELHELSAVADEISEAAKKFEAFDDESIPLLQRQLSTLEGLVI
jgi:flagellar biosynthesis chaperone FliJ